MFYKLKIIYRLYKYKNIQSKIPSKYLFVYVLVYTVSWSKTALQTVYEYLCYIYEKYLEKKKIISRDYIN